MTEVKFCRVCRTVKPLETFAKLGWRDGKQLYRPECKPCRAAEQRIVKADARRAHYDNAARVEVSPHPKGVMKFKGWGWSPVS